MHNQTHGQGIGSGEGGFSLVEVLVATAITTVAALALAGIVARSTQIMFGSESELIAKQKATEAMESVFKARDTATLTWAQIRNVVGETGADGGVFLDGFQSLRDPGNDGLANTADDGNIQVLVKPGPDNILGTADDQTLVLTDYKRQITIRTVEANLRSITVTIRYRVANGTRDYVLMTYIGAFS